MIDANVPKATYKICQLEHCTLQFRDTEYGLEMGIEDIEELHKKWPVSCALDMLIDVCVRTP